MPDPPPSSLPPSHEQTSPQQTSHEQTSPATPSSCSTQRHDFQFGNPVRLETISVDPAVRDSVSLQVIRKNCQGRIEYANDEYCQSIGRSADELIGKTDADLHSQAAAATNWELEQAVIREGRPDRVIEEHVSSTGKKNCVEVLRVPVYNNNGEIAGVESAYWDLGYRDRTKADLENARFLLDTLLENIPDAVYFKDQRSRFIRISQAHAKLFALKDPAEAIGKSDADFFGEEHAESAVLDERRIMETGESMISQVERETWDHREDTWCSTTKMPLRNEQGEIIGTFGISRDVTEQIRAEIELARERDLLKTITNNIPDPIYVKDRSGRYITGNTALLKLLGLSSVDEIAGKIDYDFFPPEFACDFVADDQIVMRTGESLLDKEECFPLPHGDHKWILTTKVPLRDEHGEITGMVGIGRDITVRKQAAEDLFSAKESADAANHAKSEFLANMSHEIRTPMNGIIGMSELLAATQLSTEQSEFLNFVQESASSLLRLLNDILDFSKIEAGRLELEEVKFDLRNCVGKAIKLLTLKADEKELELAGRIDPAIPNELIGDPGRLRQTLVNFVGNAIKFTESGEVVVDVNPEEVTEDSALLHVTVRDTGIGIPKEKQQQIFEAFSQADTSTTRHYGGTGLGLTISSRLIEMMGGRVWLESRVGVGTTFHFLVRFGVHANQTPNQPAELSVLAGTKVLVVDDNTTNRRILQEILLNWKMVPLIAENGAGALEQIKQCKADQASVGLILLDFNMPGMNGMEFAKTLMEQEGPDYCPIIILSSSASGLDPPKLRQYGVARYMTKPVIMSELLDAILEVNGISIRKAPATAPSHDTQENRPAAKILLAEDGLVNQKVAMGFLKKWGHDVRLAVNGQEAIDVLKQESFDLVLMDVQMPVMNGLEATAAIRKSEQGSERHQWIVAMTAGAMTGDREKCLASGMDDYISKPFAPEDLNRVIDAVLKGDRSFSIANERAFLDQTHTPHTKSSLNLDWKTIVKKMGGNEALVREVAEVYLGEAPELLQQIQSAITDKNQELLTRSAHTLKGATHFLEIDLIIDACKSIEKHGVSKDFTAANSELKSLVAACESLMAQLRRILESDNT